MYCCTPDIGRCFRSVYKCFLPPRASIRSYLSYSLILALFLFIWSYSRYNRLDFVEAPFCKNLQQEYVSKPARFGPPSSSSGVWSTIDVTPQNTSGLWVLYNYLSPHRPPKNNFVTLTTHITTDFLTPELPELVSSRTTEYRLKSTYYYCVRVVLSRDLIVAIAKQWSLLYAS